MLLGTCLWLENIKGIIPFFDDVNCVAHLLHNCAMRVRAQFKNIDEAMATIKAAAIKSKDRKKDFHDSGLSSPPDPVIARWPTWLRAALNYSENLSSCSHHCQLWNKCKPLSQQSKRRYHCERFGAGLSYNKSIADSSSQRRVLRRKCQHDIRSIRTAEEYAIR